jgi:uncharacterized protein (DUF1800 family)
MPASDLPDQPISDSTGKSNTDFTPLQRAFFENAVGAPDQLRQRVAFALSEIWVVSAVTVRPAYAYAPYYRLFIQNAFGNYRDIMKALTLSPAMGPTLTWQTTTRAMRPRVRPPTRITLAS